MSGISRQPYLVIALLSVNGAVGAVDIDQDAVTAARSAFVEHMVTTHEFDRETLARLLEEAEIVDRVLEAISRPAERVMPWYEYRALFVSASRIEAGAKFWLAHEDELRVASRRYGVAPEMMVAILGIETFYGERTGTYRVLDSLSTLAFAYPPRSSFFTSELEAYLLLSREEDIDPRNSLGSYAGAMGAGQFISSSFRAYAVDGNGDGRLDLWGDWEDIFASVANYFKVHGWQRGGAVVSRATLSAGWSGAEAENSMELTETVASLSQLGYIFSSELQETAATTILSVQGKDEQEYWVGYHNFRVITRYNHSVKYALAAYELGQAIQAAYMQLHADADLEAVGA